MSIPDSSLPDPRSRHIPVDAACRQMPRNEGLRDLAQMLREIGADVFVSAGTSGLAAIHSTSAHTTRKLMVVDLTRRAIAAATTTSLRGKAKGESFKDKNELYARFSLNSSGLVIERVCSDDGTVIDATHVRVGK